MTSPLSNSKLFGTSARAALIRLTVRARPYTSVGRSW
jgi:hypothetical protein